MAPGATPLLCAKVTWALGDTSHSRPKNRAEINTSKLGCKYSLVMVSTWYHPEATLMGFVSVSFGLAWLDFLLPLPAAVNCPMPRPPQQGRVVHDKPVSGSTTMYGRGWTYECNPPKAPTYERGQCMADGRPTEPPVCRGILPYSTVRCSSVASLQASVPSLVSVFHQRWAAPFPRRYPTASSPLLWWGNTATRRRWGTAAMTTTFWKERLRFSARTQGTGPPSPFAEVGH